ncbi:GNAT family N-acetyltransferase [Nocardioides sp.]|uniref:GNAT family N-acetyltransferase n=1 Tax=Nocardioides sp. TaxID=35761 RepID=UPI0027362E82|nr:GNAT family N-acetyltransferase [Nocardioides sp.]MDP3891353.1 GNAT family N-acetyltransferase [Nocardioides sp.]
MPTETRPDLVLRPATTADLDTLADLYLRARLAAVPSMPPPAHGPDEVRAWIGAWDLEALEVWLAEGVQGPVGFVAFTSTWLDCLYVDPSHQRGGVGGDLLDVVKARRPDGFGLWVFESNRPARRFYARHGLVERELTDGSENEEGAPDLWLEWPVGGAL